MGTIFLVSLNHCTHTVPLFARGIVLRSSFFFLCSSFDVRRSMFVLVLSLFFVVARFILHLQPVYCTL